MSITFILGGARSGKTAYAIAQAQAATRSGGALLMIATGQALDDEMSARIAAHQRERGPNWRTIEAPLDLSGALSNLGPDDIAVIDCLTLWLSNLMMNALDPAAATTELLAQLPKTSASLWFVSNEIGLGIVPENALARRFRDQAGALHQRLAGIADRVVLVVAGLPMIIKSGA